MRRILVWTIFVVCIVSCSTQKSTAATNENKNLLDSKQESLRISERLVLPHHLKNTGALSREIVKIDEPSGLRVKYSAPRLTSSSIFVQTLNEFTSEEKSIAAQAQYFAEANVLNLRRQGVNNTFLLKECITSKFSNTDVAYQRVIREDSNKVLHLFVTTIDQKIIFVQAWADYQKESEGYKEKFDTFLNDLIQDLEHQI
jgi:hypothetical protein